MIIAIDGPAGSGKSSVASRVAERLQFHYLDTGAMYRAIAFRALISGISFYDEEGVARIARRDPVTFVYDPNDSTPARVFIAGDDVTGAIRSARVDEAVSPVARMPQVREVLLEQQRAMASGSDVVIEGRDIGTFVFPEAELKVFLTAAPEERARRRTAQQATTGMLVDPAGVRESLERRDEIDSTREIAPLAPAPDAVVLDSTALSFDAVVDRIVRLAQERLG